MTSVVFLTVADISGKRGDSIATRELTTALAEVSSEPVNLICPTPESELPERVTEAVESVHFLPSKNGSGKPTWHLKTEYVIWKYLTEINSQNPIKSIVTRLYASTISPMIYSGMNDVKYTVLVRGWVNRTHKGGNTKFSRIVERIIEQNIRRADEVYVAFSELREWLVKYRPERSSSIQVLPNAVDPEIFKPVESRRVRRELDIDESDFVVGFVGSLEDRHALPELIKSIPETEIQVIIVGDGPRREQLELIADSHGVRDRIHFVGFVPHKEVPEYISAFDTGYGVFYPDKPSNPIKCYEYLASARPVITNHSSELKFIRSNSFGVTLDTVSVPNVVNAISQISSQTQEYRNMIGNKGRKYVITNHTWRAIAEAVFN